MKHFKIGLKYAVRYGCPGYYREKILTVHSITKKYVYLSCVSKNGVRYVYDMMPIKIAGKWIKRLVGKDHDFSGGVR